MLWTPSLRRRAENENNTCRVSHRILWMRAFSRRQTPVDPLVENKSHAFRSRCSILKTVASRTIRSVPPATVKRVCGEKSSLSLARTVSLGCFIRYIYRREFCAVGSPKIIEPAVAGLRKSNANNRKVVHGINSRDHNGRASWRNPSVVRFFFLFIYHRLKHAPWRRLPLVDLSTGAF